MRGTIRAHEDRGAALRPVLLVASSGGHLAELHALKDGWPRDARHWVTFDTPDAQSVLRGEQITFCHHPTNRNARNAARNLRLAVTLLRRLRPSAVVTTGAGVAVPFCYAARALGIKIVFIESAARVQRPSMSGRMIHPIADQFFVQWPEVAPAYSKAEYLGPLL